ncbi:MAG: LysR substrate-binding domain-containing protein [Neomegalonema sp.]|nr:LysR substrate-binding domain-containing protein [Neomegalonema sp.]
MTLTQLRYLVALADHLHFGRAAAACGVSQPTLSAQIKKLEAYLDAPLVERGGGDVGLTALGAHIVERARRMLEEADAILGAARRGADPMVGPRRIGVIPTLCPYFLPWALPAIRNDFPRLDLLCFEEMTEQLVAELRARRLDWAVMAGPFRADGLEAYPLFQEAFLAALPEAHPLAQKEATPQSALTTERLLLLSEGHCMRDQALALCATQPKEPGRTDASATGLETLRGLVAAGLGVTLAPALAARPTPGVVYRPLTPPAGRDLILVARAAPAQRVEARLIAKSIAAAYAQTARPEPYSQQL